MTQPSIIDWRWSGQNCAIERSKMNISSADDWISFFDLINKKDVETRRCKIESQWPSVEITNCVKTLEASFVYLLCQSSSIDWNILSVYGVIK